MTIAAWVKAGMPGRAVLRRNQGRRHVTVVTFIPQISSYARDLDTVGAQYQRVEGEQLGGVYFARWFTPGEITEYYGARLATIERAAERAGKGAGE